MQQHSVVDVINPSLDSEKQSPENPSSKKSEPENLASKKPASNKSTIHTSLTETFHRLQQAAASQPFPSYQERVNHLRQLKTQIQRYQDLIAEAIASDYGWRAPSESKMIDAMGPVLEINHALHSLKGWMKPQKRRTELLFLSNSLKVTYQPKGVVGIICPWNFPLYLSLGPLIASLAAGNRAMIKMPPNCPKITQLLSHMLAEIFPSDLVYVLDGNHPEAMEISHLPFNHLIFTGSANSGRHIMANASANLTPVTLELGGKSPAIVTDNYPLEDAAKRIAHGKAVNSGQVCVSPDYALVPEQKIPSFIAAVKQSFLTMYAYTANNEDCTAIVSDIQEQRFLDLLSDAKQKGAVVEVCGAVNDAAHTQTYRQYPLHIISGVTPDMRVAKEELFGPMLLVMPYATLEQAVDHIKRGPRPLACYIFSHNAQDQEYILKNSHAGGITINDCAWHVMNHDAPFGGIGDSGSGSYHGIEGFRELSHAKTVFKRHRFFPTELFYPPYGKKVQELALSWFLGKADPSLKLSDLDK